MTSQVNAVPVQPNPAKRKKLVSAKAAHHAESLINEAISLMICDLIDDWYNKLTRNGEPNNLFNSS